MARAFVIASTQYLSHAAALLTAVPMSMSAWVYKDNTTTNCTVLSIGSSTTDADFALRYNSTEDAVARSWSVLGGNNFASSSGAGNINEWTHCAAAIRTAASRDARLPLG